jgi:uncharacterized protein (DUF2147 family)
MLRTSNTEEAMNLKAVLFTVVAALAAPTVLAGEITGIWKHSEEPGWMEIRLEDGVASGKVIRNEAHPERVGRELLKGLTADESAKGTWRGQVYAERLGEYKDAEVSLPESDALQIKVKVGFMSRTVNWVRVDEVPGE